MAVSYVEGNGYVEDGGSYVEDGSYVKDSGSYVKDGSYVDSGRSMDIDKKPEHSTDQPT